VGGGKKGSGNSSINDLSTLHHSKHVAAADILCDLKTLTDILMCYYFFIVRALRL